MTSFAWLIPALPLLASLTGIFGARRLPGGARTVAVGGTAIAAALSLALAVEVLRDPGRVRETSMLLTPTGGIDITVGTRVDGLSALVTVMVCVVALLVQIYSTGYLADDPRYPTYAAIVSLFTGAMLLVVLASDLLQLLVGWEVMGVCSYFLIGHYFTEPHATAAATKAFLMTRLGDVGFLFGIFTLGVGAGSFRISDVLAAAPELDTAVVVAGTLLLICGVAGKSAQFPLHTWLPDAMAGPTPISALIHAATMVAAGVYVVALLYPVFVLSRLSMDVLGVLAAITMVLGALAALTQRDIKRVLAYSTVSQLAYMLGGLAVGGYAAGLFHLLTHAAFKALLFLAAGAVIYRIGSNYFEDMGGLRKAMPITFLTMTIGLAALAGLPPFAGFFSKDAVLGSAYEVATGHALAVLDRPVAVLVLACGLVTVLLTGAYVARLWLLTFFGAGSAAAASAREVPAAMRVPLLVLALPSALLGLAALSHTAVAWLPTPEIGWFGYSAAGEIEPPPFGHVAPDPATAVATSVLSLAGIAGMYLAWRRQPTRDPALLLGPLRAPFDRAFYVDDVYDAAVVRPTPALARTVLAVDDRAVDGTVNGSASGAGRLGGALRRLQNGNVQGYATGVVVGAVLLAAGAAVFS